MSRELYNEGRVRGESCYEAYVKNALEEDPNTQPVSEREWLASTLAMGSSMLLKIDPFTPEKEDNIVKDYKLPDESSLIAPSTIIASFFAANPSDFSGIYDDTGWVTQVGSYGDLLKVTSTEPNKGGVYSYNDNSMNEDEKKRMLNYMRIQDGLVLQDGTWETRTASNNPKRILKQPNFTDSPTVRIRFAHEVTTSFFVLLTGFVTFGVVIGESGFGGGAAGTANPYNGDFLGPAVFPWANKIMFHTSASMAYQSQTSLQAGSGNVEIDTNPDSFDTYIKVKNKIESLTKYLIVEQDDPDYASYTTLDLDTYNLFKDRINPGTGIYMTYDQSSGSMNVRTYLKAGTGITLSPEQTTTNNEETIATNIQGGVGITTSTASDGGLIITNSATSGTFSRIVDMSNSTSNFQIFADGDWDTAWNYTTSTTASSVERDTKKDVWIMWYNGFFAHEDGGSHYTYSNTANRGCPNIRYQPSFYYHQDGTVETTSARIRIIPGDYKIHNGLNMKSSSTFQFAHADPWYEKQSSWILKVVFPKDGGFSELSRNSSGDPVKLISSTYSPDVWNIYSTTGTIGGSWTVTLGLVNDQDYASLGIKGIPAFENYSTYVLYAINIIDGYNDQYSSSYAYPYANYTTLYAGALGISMEWTVSAE